MAKTTLRARPIEARRILRREDGRGRDVGSLVAARRVEPDEERLVDGLRLEDRRVARRTAEDRVEIGRPLDGRAVGRLRARGHDDGVRRRRIQREARVRQHRQPVGADRHLLEVLEAHLDGPLRFEVRRALLHVDEVDRRAGREGVLGRLRQRRGIDRRGEAHHDRRVRAEALHRLEQIDACLVSVGVGRARFVRSTVPSAARCRSFGNGMP